VLDADRRWLGRVLLFLPSESVSGPMSVLFPVLRTCGRDPSDPTRLRVDPPSLPPADPINSLSDDAGLIVPLPAILSAPRPPSALVIKNSFDFLLGRRPRERVHSPPCAGLYMSLKP